jgi:sec-independent protein translocase protein TatC
LIELRSRLIKALVAFGLTFIACFFLAGDIYNILIKPFAWVAGAEHTKFIYTALLEYFWTKLKLAMFGAAFISFPVIAGQIYYVRRSRALSSRAPGVPALSDRYPFLLCLGRDGRIFPCHAHAGALLARHAATGRWAGADRVIAESGEYLDLMMWLVLAFGVAFSASGDPDGCLGAWASSRRSSSGANAGISSSAPSSSRRILTPPDVISQLSLALPLMLLYEGSIWSVRYIEKRAAAARVREATKAEAKPAE